MKNERANQIYQKGKEPEARPAAQELYKTRIILKNLVYVIGLSPEISEEKVLYKPEYFGQYGKIMKIVVNRDKPFNPRGPSGPTYSAYITYSNDQEASLAIFAIDNYEYEDKLINASYGTTKYCYFFLKDKNCPNPDCLYLHSEVGHHQIIPRDIVNNKELFYEQQKLVMSHLANNAQEILNLNLPVVKNSEFPNIEHTTKKLIEYCQEHSIKLVRPEKSREDFTQSPSVSQKDKAVYPALQLTPDVSKSPKPPQDSPAKWMDQEDKRAETLTTVQNKAADELSGTSDSRLTALSEIDKIIYRRLREEYTKSNACQNNPKDTQESVDGTNEQSVKGLPYIIELINNYIEKSGDTNSGKEREKETATSDCKSKGSGGERKFQLFDQRYTVSLTKQGLIYRGLQERRSRSLKRSQEREQAIAMPDKSYSHTSK